MSKDLNIVLKKEISKIKWNNNEDKLIHIFDKTGKLISKTEKIVITCPVNLYKKLNFVPALPKWKSESIKNFYSNPATKIIFIFKKTNSNYSQPFTIPPHFLYVCNLDAYICRR